MQQAERQGWSRLRWPLTAWQGIAWLSIAWLGAVTPATAAAPAGEAGPGRPYQVHFGKRIPMVDGVSLNATIVTPYPLDEPRPVILTLTPYGADRYYPIATRFAREGYVAAIVEVRGRGDSGGEFVPYERDLDDGMAVIAWLARQPFSNGAVGMRGGSYTGFLQWGLAARGAPALKTIIPGAPPYFGVDSPTYRGVQIPYRLRWYALVAGRQRNGNFNGDRDYWQGLYRELARGEVALADLAREAGLPGSYWRESFTRSYVKRLARLLPSEEQLARLKIPVLSITGFHDGAQLGTLTHFRRAAAEAPPDSRLFQVIGPWDHHGVSNPQDAVGGIAFPAAASTPTEWHLAWFDWVLRDGPKPAFLKDRVTYFSQGEDRWRGRAALDAGTGELVLYPTSPRRPAADAASGGSLGTAPASSPAPEPEDCWRYDPRDPPISWGPYFGKLAAGDEHLLDDPLPATLGGRGLVYDSEPLRAPVSVAGNPTLSARLKLDVPDTDLAAVLYLLRPDGRMELLAWDMLRARYRRGFQQPAALLEPGRYADYRFELTWFARELPAGSRLRLMLTSPGISYFFHRNRNSGRPVAEETLADSRVATICLQPGAQENRLSLVLDR